MEALMFILAFIATVLLSLIGIVVVMLTMVSKKIHSGMVIVSKMLTKTLRFLLDWLKRQ